MCRALLLCLLVAGCASMGPQSVPRDRFDYVTSISESWKRQMLLNLLKVRYADAPVFLDVSSAWASATTSPPSGWMSQNPTSTGASHGRPKAQSYMDSCDSDPDRRREALKLRNEGLLGMVGGQ
jgi:hypothetical protein